jgi:hydrogenase-4 component B
LAALDALALVVGALLLLGAGCVLVAPTRRGLVAHGGCVALCGIGLLADLAYLAAGAPPATLTLPVGLPGMVTTLALDGLSGFFALLVLGVGAAASTAALDDHHGDYLPTAPALPVFIAAMALTLLAGDGFSLVLGFEAMSLASFALVLNGHRDPDVRGAALLYLGIAAIGAACLIPALALLAQPGGLAFAAMRAHPPQGWRAAVVLLLAIAGAGSKAGLAPLHIWLPPAHASAPGHVSALMSGAMTKVALYVLARLLFDLCGPAQPLWWGVPLLVLGAAGAVLGGLRANLEADLKSVLACSTIENVGLITVGLGLALAARAADLPPLAALAMGGALLHALAHGLFKGLLFLGAGAVQHQAGTRKLHLLGGLVRGMPITTACVIAGGACLAALPPSSGFAGEWTLFQAVLGAPRIGGLAFQTLVCVVAALMALAAALAASAAVRLIGVAFLGRPRSPRAAAAEEAGWYSRAAMAGLIGVSAVIGLFPGGVLALAAPALQRLTGAALPGAGALVLAPQADGPGLAAPALAVLLGLALAATAWVVRRRTVAGHRTAPAWDCGFGPPPPWLPFGDPATQYGGASFGQPLRRALGSALLHAREHVDMPLPGDVRPARMMTTAEDPADALLFRPVGRLREALSELADHMQLLTVRRTLSVMFLALVLLLAIVALMEQW